MLTVKKRKNEDIDSLLRRFAKAVSRAGIRHDMKRKEYYIKPSLKRHRNKQDAKFKERKLKKEQEKKRATRKRRKRTGLV